MAIGKHELPWRTRLTVGLVQVSIAMVVITSVNVFFTLQAVDRSNKASTRSISAVQQSTQNRIQAICPVFQILDHVYSVSPPTTDVGRRLRDAIKEAIINYGCPNA